MMDLQQEADSLFWKIVRTGIEEIRIELATAALPKALCGLVSWVVAGLGWISTRAS